MDPGTLNEYAEIIAISVLLLGAVLAQIGRMLVGRALGLLGRRLAQNTASGVSVISPAVVQVLETLVFWLVIVVAVVAALRILGVGGFSTLLDEVIGYVPRLVIALTIVGAGHLLGLMARGLLSRVSASMHADSLVPRVAHVAILVVAVIVALQHLRIDISFVTQILLVLLAIGSGGLVLAFALGARQHVANLVARSELGRHQVGDRIRIDGQEGTIVEVRATGLDLATEDGVLSVPASRFAEVMVLKLTEQNDGG